MISLPFINNRLSLSLLLITIAIYVLSFTTSLSVQRNLASTNCINVDAAKFIWTTTSDSVVGTVHFPPKDLEKGWIAVGVSNFIGFGMNDADILLLWKQGGTYQHAYKKAPASGTPNPASGQNFETFSVEETNGRIVLHFSKKFKYPNTAGTIEIKPDTVSAILLAMNDRETPINENQFGVHGWRMKRYVNFISDTTVNECGGSIPPPPPVAQSPSPSLSPSLPPAKSSPSPPPIPIPSPTIVDPPAPVPSFSSLPPLPAGSSSTSPSGSTPVVTEPSHTNAGQRSHDVAGDSSEGEGRLDSSSSSRTILSLVGSILVASLVISLANMIVLQ